MMLQKMSLYAEGVIDEFDMLALSQIGYVVFPKNDKGIPDFTQPKGVIYPFEFLFEVLYELPSGNGRTGGATGGPRFRPRTEQEYQACVDQAAATRDNAVSNAREEQLVGGVATLGGVAAIWVTYPVITEAIVEGVEAEPISGTVEALHSQMAYGIVGSTAFIPFYGFVKGLSDQAKAMDNYDIQVTNCAGPVRIP